MARPGKGNHEPKTILHAVQRVVLPYACGHDGDNMRELRREFWMTVGVVIVWIAINIIALPKF